MILAFQNPEFNILAESKFLGFQNPDFIPLRKSDFFFYLLTLI